jgi:hypothetical protein
MESVLLDVAGHRRSPATMLGYRRGCSRRSSFRARGDRPVSRRTVSVTRAA